MSEEKVTPAERLAFVNALVGQSIDALHDVTAWLQDGNLSQAYAALECAGEPLSDIEDWLNDAAEAEEDEAAPSGSAGDR